MFNLVIKPNSLLNNKGEVTLSFDTKAAKKAFVKAYLKPPKASSEGAAALPLAATAAEEAAFEAQLWAWALEKGYVLPLHKSFAEEHIKFLSIYATAMAKVRRLGEFLSVEEYNNKMLSPFTMRRLGVKGSPKLSKVLVHLGVDSRRVELFLAGSSKGEFSSKVTNDKEYILDQGLSTSYYSCQANPRGKHYKANEDVKAPGLFLWYVGERWGLDSKGFIARAKLRLLYNDQDCTQLAGLYIDRPYGLFNMLLERLDELVNWWNSYNNGVKLPIYIAPVWQRDNGADNDFEDQFGGRSQPMYCPSGEYGYHDTMTNKKGPYTFFEVLVKGQLGSLTKQAYTSRPTDGQVYLTSLKDTVFHSQKAKFVSMSGYKQPKPWLGVVKDVGPQNEMCYISSQVLTLLGWKQRHYSFGAIVINKTAWSIVEKTMELKLHLSIPEKGMAKVLLEKAGSGESFLSFVQNAQEETVITVLQDWKKGGFFAPIDIEDRYLYDDTYIEDLELLDEDEVI